MSFPQAPEYIIRAVFEFFFWKFGEIFAAQGAPTVLLTMANSPRVSMTEVIISFSKITLKHYLIAYNLNWTYNKNIKL